MGTICFHAPVPDEIAGIIMSGVKGYFQPDDVKAIQSLHNCQTVAGSYCVVAAKRKWFVRVSSRIGDILLESRVLDYLSGQNDGVNPILFSTSVRDDGGRKYRLDIRPFIDGRHYTGGMDELKSLLLNLDRLHGMLKKIPDKTKIKNNAAQRYGQLAGMGDSIRQGLAAGNLDFFKEAQSWANTHQDWLNRMADGFQPDFHLASDAQPIHGEVHTGNVVFNDDGLVFIDFEETIHTYASPAWDLAYVIQRFCFWGNPSPSLLADRCRLLDEQFDFDLKQLAEMMHQVSWFSIAVLLDLRWNQGVVSPVSEYEKFVILEARADILESLS